MQQAAQVNRTLAGFSPMAGRMPGGFEREEYENLYAPGIAEIRTEYAKLNPDDIKIIENCTTSLIRIQAA